MRVAQLRLRHFRNHTDTSLDPGDGINAFLGYNGQGKTNVLEAVSYLSLTKSFYASGDGTVLQLGREMFEVEGKIITDNDIEYSVRVAYTAQGEKVFTINGIKPDTLASVIGRFPIVILSPENSSITFGGPMERRKFIDLLLSQISRAYLEDLLEYRRALKQRNRILAEARALDTYSPELVEPWTIALMEHGARIIRHRLMFIGEFLQHVKDAYAKLVAHRGTERAVEDPDIQYATIPGVEQASTLEGIRSLMGEEIERRHSEERRRGTTLVGPHRDELLLALNGMSMQQFASQGQHKTLLVALKIAEFEYLKERRQEVPIVLLDDVFTELDERRSRFLLDTARTLGQTFITTTDESAFRGAVQWNGSHRKFYVESGKVRAA